MTAKVMGRMFDIQNSRRMKSLIFHFNSKLSIKELDIHNSFTSSLKHNFRSILVKSLEKRVNCFTGVRSQRKN